MGTMHPSILHWDFVGGMLVPRQLSFSRSSTGTCWDGSGVMRTAPANGPRLDHDPATGARRGLLIEEQRTNLLLNSASLSTQSVSVSATAYTLSFYGTGTVTLSGAYSGTLTGSAATARAALTFTPAASTLTCTVSGTVSYANLEAGAFATSWIPTAGSSATRAADQASALLSAVRGWSEGEGTLLIELEHPAPTSGSNQRAALHIGRSTDVVDNGYSIFIESGSRDSYAHIRKAGVTSANFTTGQDWPSGPAKVAIAWKSGDSAVSFGGAAVITSATTDLPTALDTIFLGSLGSFAAPWGGWLRRLTLFPRRLVNADLISLTSGD